MPKQVVTIIKHGRRGTGKKEPLKESNYEMFLRIQAENEAKEKKKSDKAIKRLKQEGKVQSLAGFLICNKDADGTQDEWMESKLKRPNKRHKRNPSRRETVKAIVPQATTFDLPPLDDSSDEEDAEKLKELLSFHPFRTAHNHPILPNQKTSSKPAHKL